MQCITLPDLEHLDHFILLNIRTFNECEAGQLLGAKHISLGQLLQPEQYYTVSDNLVIYCDQEQLSEVVADNLQNLGYNALLLKGGNTAYKDLKVQGLSICN